MSGLNIRHEKQFLYRHFMTREEIVSRLIFLPMVLSGNYVSLKMAQIKAGNKENLFFFLPQVVEEK